MATAAINIPPVGLTVCCCSICMEPYRDPRMLQCGHTFCLKCMEDWHIQGNKDHIVCPKCRGKTQLTNSNVKTLPKNFQVRELLEIWQNASCPKLDNDNETRCEVCSFDSTHHASFHCNNCNKDLCTACKDHHKRDTLFKNHTLVTVNISTEAKSLYCTVHSRERLIYFCNVCKVPICPTCAMQLPHMKHSKSDIGDVAKKLELEHIRSNLKNIFDLNKRDIKILMESDTELAHVDDKVTEEANKIKDKTTRWEKMNKDIIQKERGQIIAVVERKQLTNAMIESSMDVFKDDDDVNAFITQSSSLISGLPNLPYEKLSGKLRVTFKEKKVDLVASLGSVQIKTIPLKQAVTSEVKVPDVVQYGQMHKPQLIWKCDSEGSNKGQVNSPQGVAFTQDDDIIIADTYNNWLQVFDVNTGQSLHTIGDGQITPYDVAVNSDYIYATDYKNKCVQVYTATGVHKQSWGKGKYSKPRGITSLRNGNIAVTDHDNNTVSIHDNSTGRITTSFGQTGNDKTCLKHPTYITEDSKGSIIINDYGSCSIKIYDSAGNMLQVITETGKKITNPRGVCVDSNDNILLAMWGDDSVVKFDCSGRYLGTVLTREDVRRPAGVALHPGGEYLALTEWDCDHAALKLFKIA